MTILKWYSIVMLSATLIYISLDTINDKKEKDKVGFILFSAMLICPIIVYLFMR